MFSGISVALWRRAGACLGRQLVREGEVLRGAEYLVSSGQVSYHWSIAVMLASDWSVASNNVPCQVVEGVETLAKHGHYRAAAAVARARLEPDCDLVTSVMRGWAGQSQADGEAVIMQRPVHFGKPG